MDTTLDDIPDTIHVELQEGMIVRMNSSRACAPRALFELTLWSSVFLGGKPVHCSGLLPGVSLAVHAQVSNMDQQQKQDFVEHGWEHIKSLLDQWIEIAEQMPCINTQIGGTKVTFALDRQIMLNKGVMQIEAAPDWSGQGGEAPYQVCIPNPARLTGLATPSKSKRIKLWRLRLAVNVVGTWLVNWASRPPPPGGPNLSG